MSRNDALRFPDLLMLPILTLAAHGLRVTAQTVSEVPAIKPAEVTANDVYVRSGESMNHYAICKLNAGDKVQIIGERSEWYEILPPDGTFSLVSGEYIDTTDDQSGTVNANNVRVRAGSLLNDNKYTVQALLSKGTQVSILGRNPDGFLKIKPPVGATLWISRAYVAPLSADGSRIAQPGPTISATGALPEGEDAVKEAPGASGESRPAKSVAISAADDAAKKLVAPMTATATTSWQRQLQDIDAQVRLELAKPAASRSLDSFRSKYQAIADQVEDDFARQYATHRMQQLENFLVLDDTLKKVRGLDEAAEARRREYLAARSEIPHFTPPLPGGIEVQGILRTSALYPEGVVPRRFRLTDPSTPDIRTIGYVEIPADSDIRAEEFVGRLVGVRASEQRVQSGGVDPIPIYVAKELIPMESAETPDRSN